MHLATIAPLASTALGAAILAVTVWNGVGLIRERREARRRRLWVHRRRVDRLWRDRQEGPYRRAARHGAELPDSFDTWIDRERYHRSVMHYRIDEHFEGAWR